MNPSEQVATAGVGLDNIFSFSNYSFQNNCALDERCLSKGVHFQSYAMKTTVRHEAPVETSSHCSFAKCEIIHLYGCPLDHSVFYLIF
ncbi:hypothetical protein CPB84DRAFT_1765109 [Gymnopilus junonius]|uniref:Uncharacterized protein n=1 Tax=Gymnopilus junonius TaxID=109634 RepID=A0A9P5NUG3_GYMJU|nr:hypothetical protein CPB84DRAFT_1765109 [Gymnopilus junonius]